VPMTDFPQFVAEFFQTLCCSAFHKLTIP